MRNFRHVISEYDDEKFEFDLEAMDGEIAIVKAVGLTSGRVASSDEIESLNHGNSDERDWIRAMWEGV